jgi:hypothetical protein
LPCRNHDWSHITEEQKCSLLELAFLPHLKRELGLGKFQWAIFALQRPLLARQLIAALLNDSVRFQQQQPFYPSMSESQLELSLASSRRTG